MSFNKLEFRQTKQDCHCKSCDRVIKRNTEKVIVFTPFRGHSDTVHICLNCINNINKIIQDQDIIKSANDEYFIQAEKTNKKMLTQ